MNRNLTLLAALGASLATVPAVYAQAAPAAAPAAVAPQATDAKIALVNFAFGIRERSFFKTLCRSCNCCR